MVERQQLNKKPGLGDAVRLAGLEFSGTHHRGIDEARNIARLLPYIFSEARGAPNIPLDGLWPPLNSNDM